MLDLTELRSAVITLFRLLRFFLLLVVIFEVLFIFLLLAVILGLIVRTYLSHHQVFF